MRKRARGGRRLGEASVAVVGAGRTPLTIVAECDERTRWGTVPGQPSLSHPGDDTSPDIGRTAFDTPQGGSDTSLHLPWR